MSVHYTEEQNKKSKLIAEQIVDERRIVVKVLLYKTVEGRPSLQSYVGVIKKDSSSSIKGKDLEKFYIDSLLEYLKIPKSSCEVFVIEILSKYFAPDLMKGKVLEDREAIILYWMAFNLSISKSSDKKVTLETLKKLKIGNQCFIRMIYDSQKPKFKKLLTASQIRDLEAVLMMNFL